MNVLSRVSVVRGHFSRAAILPPESPVSPAISPAFVPTPTPVKSAGQSRPPAGQSRTARGTLFLDFAAFATASQGELDVRATALSGPGRQFHGRPQALW